VARQICFFFDQHISPAVASSLRAHHVDVLTAQEAARCGLPDPDQLSYATAEGRVLVTFDTDYLILDASGVPHAGIAWCSATKYSIGELTSALLLVCLVMSPDEMLNHVEFL
jgi:predicted nuclease of predicted toxin-antitoxin system